MHAAKMSKRTLLSRARKAFSTSSVAMAGAAEASKRRFFPPGVDATRGQVEVFTRLVSKALEAGCIVELTATGKCAMHNSLRALSVGGGATRFQVCWASTHNATEVADTEVSVGVLHETRRQLRLVALRASVGEDLGLEGGGGIFVSSRAEISQLTRKFATDICTGGCVVAQTYVDSSNAMSTLLQSLASVPASCNDQPLSCAVMAVRLGGESRTRAFVRAVEVVPIGRGEGDTNNNSLGQHFRAFPPGRGADSAASERFDHSVSQRLGHGQTVLMECRGKKAVLGAIMALARARGRTAEFEVHWTQSSTLSASKSADASAVARSIQIRANRGPTWPEFNSTVFSNTRLLKANATTPVTGLARAIGSDVKSLGGVAVHAFADDGTAVSAVVKSFATVPLVHNGQRVMCVASLGRAEDARGSPNGSADRVEADDGGGRLVVRFYARSLRPRLREWPSSRVGVGGASQV